jgi:hypothetical protein
VNASARNRPLHISVVALPETILSPLIGLYEVFDVMRLYASADDAFPKETVLSHGDRRPHLI